MPRSVKGRNGGTLIPAQPGEVRNPRGSTTPKAKRKRYLKELIRERLNEPLTEAQKLRLEAAAESIGLSVEDITRGVLLSEQIVHDALKGDRHSRDQVIATEPKSIDVSGELHTSPDFVSTPEEDEAFTQSLRDGGALH